MADTEKKKPPFLYWNIFKDKVVTKEGLRKVLSNFSKETTTFVKEHYSVVQVVELNNILYPQLYKSKQIFIDANGKATFDVSIEDFPKSEKLHKMGKKLTKVEVSINEKTWYEIEAKEFLHLEFDPDTKFAIEHGDIVFIRYTYEDLPCDIALGFKGQDEGSLSKAKFKLGDVIPISKYFSYKESSSELYDYVLYKDNIEYKRYKYFENIVITEDLLEENVMLKKEQVRKILDVYNDIDKSKNTFIVPVRPADEEYTSGEHIEYFTAKNTAIGYIYNLLRERFDLVNIFHNADWKCTVNDSIERTEIVFTRKVYKYKVEYETSHLGGLTEKPRSFVMSNFDRNYIHALDGSDSDIFRTWATLYLAIRYPQLYTYEEKTYEEENLTHTFRFEFYESRRQFYEVKRDAAFEKAREQFFEAFEYRAALKTITDLYVKYEEAQDDPEVKEWQDKIEHYILAIEDIHKYVENKQFDEAIARCNEYIANYESENFDANNTIHNYVADITSFREAQTAINALLDDGKVRDAKQSAEEYLKTGIDFNEYFKKELVKFNTFIEQQDKVLELEAAFKIEEENIRISAYLDLSESEAPDYGQWFEAKLAETTTFLEAYTKIVSFHNNSQFAEELAFINEYLASDNHPDYKDPRIDPNDEQHSPMWIADKKKLCEQFVADKAKIDAFLTEEMPDGARKAYELAFDKYTSYWDYFNHELTNIGSTIGLYVSTVDKSTEHINKGEYDEALTVLKGFLSREIREKYADYDKDFAGFVQNRYDNLSKFVQMCKDVETLRNEGMSSNKDFKNIMDRITEYTQHGGKDYNNTLQFLYWRASVENYMYCPNSAYNGMSAFEYNKAAGENGRAALQGAYQNFIAEAEWIPGTNTKISFAKYDIDNGEMVDAGTSENGCLWQIRKVAIGY